jgi:hypothetical protein
MDTNSEILSKSAPIFTAFSLFGMNGYKNISISCNSPIKIACADNGSGKTSLLNALYSIFVGQPSLLYGLDFEALEMIWADGSTSRWKKSELFGGLKRDDLVKMARELIFVQWEVAEKDAIDLITKFILNDFEEVVQTQAYRLIYAQSPYDRQEIFDQLSAIVDQIEQTGQFHALHKRAQEALGEVEILYLPTYRRIEADIPEFRGDRHIGNMNSNLRLRGRQSKSAWDSTKLIYFGMSDVESRLTSIVTQIRKETLEAYSRSNGQTLEQLVGNRSTTEDQQKEAFDFAAIEVVLARVGRNNGDLKESLKNIIASGEIYEQGRRELRRFLNQLLRVYAERRDDEQAIGDFVNIVNQYISPEVVGGKAGEPYEKRLIFDKLKLELAVKNEMTGKDIRFGALSSGEKQVVSIFARLMLDPRRRYLILIDEPELSLSIEWQQRLLPDIFATNNCIQMVAITHSPFIFENDFAVAAGSIDVSFQVKNELDL